MKNVHMCYIEEKLKIKKKIGKMSISTQNFIILKQVVAEKTLTNVHMCYIGVTEGKLEKEGK